MTTKVYKVTLCVVDHNDYGIGAITSAIEDSRYPNRCIGPKVVDVALREVEWSDDHPLNSRTMVLWRPAFDELFEPPGEDGTTRVDAFRFYDEEENVTVYMLPSGHVDQCIVICEDPFDTTCSLKTEEAYQELIKKAVARNASEE